MAHGGSTGLHWRHRRSYSGALKGEEAWRRRLEVALEHGRGWKRRSGPVEGICSMMEGADRHSRRWVTRVRGVAMKGRQRVAARVTDGGSDAWALASIGTMVRWGMQKRWGSDGRHARQGMGFEQRCLVGGDGIDRPWGEVRSKGEGRRGQEICGDRG